MTKEYTKDYSLLRPFDLEAAKRGDALTSCDSALFKGAPIWEYVAGPDVIGKLCIKILSSGEFAQNSHPSSFRMTPLCWVEGKPVYVGDTLYYRGVEPVLVTGPHPSYLYVGNGVEYSGSTSEHSFTVVSYLTWQKPKQKREGWVNVYPKLGSYYNVACKVDKYTFATQDIADKYAERDRVACIRIEWEEEEE